VKNGDQIANSTRRCAPTRQNRPLFEVSLSLPGYRFYVVRRHGHPCEKIIRAFSAWLRSVK